MKKIMMWLILLGILFINNGCSSNSDNILKDNQIVKYELEIATTSKNITERIEDDLDKISIFVKGKRGNALKETLYPELWTHANVIDWVYFSKNNVYIGFSEWSRYWEWLIQSLALRGNKCINFGCHVWALPSNEYDIKEFIAEKYEHLNGYYYECTARYGKIR